MPPTTEALTPPPSIFHTAAAAGKPDMVFEGGCLVTQSLDNPIQPGVGEPGDFFPTSAVSSYFNNVRRIDLDVSKAKISVVNGPRHGTLVQLSSEDAAKLGIGVTSGPLHRYRPNSQYLGPDNATLRIELDGAIYRTHTMFYVVNKVGDNGYPAGSAAGKCGQSQPRRIALQTFQSEVVKIFPTKPEPVVPAHAGTQAEDVYPRKSMRWTNWIPAFAGMTGPLTFRG